MKALGLEFFKAKRRGVILCVMAILLGQIMWLFSSLRGMDARELSQGYMQCRYQMSIINAIVLPVLVCVLVSRLCDIEHKGASFKSLFTMQDRGALFNAKLACEGLILLITCALQLILIFAMGKYKGFTDVLSIADAVIYILSQWAVCLFLALLIQTLALKYVNQFVPLVAGLMNGFLGLMSMFFPDWLMRFFPSAYYGLLCVVRMNWDKETRVVTYYGVPFSWGDLLLLMGAFCALYVFAVTNFKRGEE